MSKNILVVTALERSFYSSVIENQLLNPIGEISKKRGGSFYYVGFIPFTFWITRGEVFRSFKLYRQNRAKLKKRLNKAKVGCKFFPIFSPFRHIDFYLRTKWVPFFLLNTFFPLLYFIFRYRISFLHVRNYPAGLLSYLVKKLTGIEYNFDPRDLYPEKGIERGVFKGEGDINYRFWKYLEKKIIKEAKWVIVTSQAFYEYMKERFSPKNIKLLPNSVNLTIFKPNFSLKKELRRKYNLHKKFILLHSGAFGTQKDVNLVGRYFLKWKKKKENSHLLILCSTKKYLPFIKETLQQEGLTLSDYTLISPKFHDVPHLLLLGDVGLNLEEMAIATPYSLAVKVGEYLAIGLPVIVTCWLKGVTHLIEKYKAGIVIQPDKMEDFTQEEWLLKNYPLISNNAISLAQKELNYTQLVQKLSSIL